MENHRCPVSQETTDYEGKHRRHDRHARGTRFGRRGRVHLELQHDPAREVRLCPVKRDRGEVPALPVQGGVELEAGEFEHGLV